jgi:hypothetical protein
MTEIFKDIIGYEGLYQISNLGNVKSLEKKLKNGNGYAVRKEIIMTPGKKENDYLFVYLCKNGSKKAFYVHRLVAIHYIPNPENKPEVNHKKSNKTDNRYFMLEWNTREENLVHSYKEGTRKPQFGSSNSAARLTENKVKKIREIYSLGETSQRKLAESFNVSHAIIHGVINKTRWSHVK